MADITPAGTPVGAGTGATGAPFTPMSLDEARAHARERFKTRVQAGEKVGGCDCHTEDQATVDPAAGPAARVAGVRFRDSGRTYYFDATDHHLHVGDWVVVETSRGQEAGRVIIAPHQVALSQLQGELKPVLRTLDDDDVRRMDALKRDAGSAVKVFSAKIRERRLPLKAISAEFNFDGSNLTLNYSTQDRVDLRDLARDVSSHFGCRVELKQVGPRDEARLLGGLGRCGRTLCCSSWLPVYPEISMGMAKTQDLGLNPGKVSGVCGRLLCCLSYENEQYKQMKAVMPRLGQPIETPMGPGTVISLQIIRELVTVRLADENKDVVFASADLGLRKPAAVEPQIFDSPPAPAAPVETVLEEVPETEEVAPSEASESGGRRRRRRRGRGGGQQRSRA